MIDGVRFKVCGLTSLVDAHLADRLGADYLGFILYPGSPRYVSRTAFALLEPNLPDRPKVAVVVEPEAAELAATAELGFDRFQIHFRPSEMAGRLADWSAQVGADRLWFAPKLAPGSDLDPTWLSLAKTWMIDTFSRDQFGGTGHTGDWPKFARLQHAYPDRTWVLAGGINAGNIGEALEHSGTRFVDVNSGVEASPGIKDEAKLKAFVAALHRARTGD